MSADKRNDPSRAIMAKDKTDIRTPPLIIKRKGKRKRKRKILKFEIPQLMLMPVSHFFHTTILVARSQAFPPLDRSALPPPPTSAAPDLHCSGCAAAAYASSDSSSPIILRFRFFSSSSFFFLSFCGNCASLLLGAQ